MKAIVNGRILLPGAEVQGKALVYDKKIVGVMDEAAARAMADEVIDAAGMYVSPGLVDVHIHGYLGADVSDADNAGVRKMAKGILANGVTSFLPTTMTIGWSTLETIFAQLRQLREESRSAAFEGAEILGCHAEGPFINPAKKGAQAEENILPPDAEKVLPYADIIRMISFAPEMPGGDQFIRTLKEKTDITLSIGHTSANYDQAMNAIRLGANHITHTFNAMTPMMHRDPGVVGAALTTDVYCQLIVDTFHVHKGLFPLMHKAKGEHLVLITDCLRSCGMPDGEYELGGQQFVLKGIECRLLDGTIAGSVLKLNNAVRNMREHTNLPLEQIVRMASINAARCIGLDKTKGSLEAGKDADIILADENFAVSETIIAGETVWAAE